MFTEATNEPESESEFHTKAELVEDVVSFEDTMEPSDEFFRIFEVAYKFSQNTSTFTKKEIKTMETKLEKLYNKVANLKDALLNDIITLAYSYQLVCYAYVHSDQKGKLHIAKNCVLRSLNLIKNKELDPKIIVLILKSYYHLGHIYAKQKKTEKAIQIFEKAVELYLAYTQENTEYGSPIDFQDIIQKSDEKINGYEKLKALFTYILKSLLELHESVIPTNNESMITYEHLLLVAEFSFLREIGECIQWIEHVITLSQALLKYSRFKEAYSHIITAFYVMHTFVEEPSNEMKDNDMKRQKLSSDVSELKEKKNTIWYLLTMQWGKLAVAILRKSTERLLQLEDENLETDNSESKYPKKSNEQLPQKLLLLDELGKLIPIPSEFQTKIPYILNHNTYFIFIDTLRYTFRYYGYLERFVPSDNKIRIYIQLILNICNAYKYMALYETDISFRNLLQDRRVFLLTHSTRVIGLEDPHVLKYLQLQRVIAFSSIINTKLDNLETVHSLYTPERYNTIMFEIEKLVKDILFNSKMYTIHFKKD